MGYITYMTNTQENIVYWSDDDRYLVINTRNSQGKYHNWLWVIVEQELYDHTEWDYNDVKFVTDEQIESCEFPAGVQGFFIYDEMDS